MDLLSSILGNVTLRGFFFLGAYRNREVNEFHPFSKVLEALEEQENRTLFLAPLELEAITQMLQETFQCSEKASQSLSEIVLQKTGGNPFFMNQFLSHLVKQGMIYFNRREKKWNWKTERIKSTSTIIFLPRASWY